MLLDKVQDKSHAIQPAFGGFNDLGAGAIVASFQQILQEVLETPVEDIYEFINQQPPTPLPPLPAIFSPLLESVSSLPSFGIPQFGPAVNTSVTPASPSSFSGQVSASPMPPSTTSLGETNATFIPPSSIASPVLSFGTLHLLTNGTTSLTPSPPAPSVTSPQNTPLLLPPPGAQHLSLQAPFAAIQSYFVFSPETSSWEPAQNSTLDNQNSPGPLLE